MNLYFLLPAYLLALTTANAHFTDADYQQYSVKGFRDNKSFLRAIDFVNPDYALINAAVFYVTNEQRVRKKLPPLEHNSHLELAAWHHSKSMADGRFFNHINASVKARRTPDDRAKLAGITNPYIAENIAEMPAIEYVQGKEVFVIDKKAGTFSYTNGGEVIPPHTYLSFAEAVVAQWMDSPPHRKNILSKEALQLGCGIYLYADRDFYNMPTFKATQNFQQFEPVKAGEAKDSLPF